MKKESKPGFFEKFLGELKEKTTGKKLKKDQLVIMLLIGVLLIIIVLPTETKEEEKKETEPGVSQAESETTLTETDYITILEEKLKRALSKVDGVGNVEVMITLKSSGEKVVEKDIPNTRSEVTETDSEGGERITKESTSTETTVYTQGGDGTTSPYVIKELEPQIGGVIVIAQGGGNPVTVQNISEAIKALFEVEVHKIKVMKMN